jgi:hypothetical protein
VRRLRPGQDTPATRVIQQFVGVNFRSIAVDCDGRIYFIARPIGSNLDVLFRLDSFQGALRNVRINGYSAGLVDALAVDAQGRLLAADLNPDGTQAVERLNVAETPTGPEATRDADFVVAPFLEGAGALTSDATGVIYAAAVPEAAPVGFGGLVRIVALNELGDRVYTIATYEYECPPGCALAACGDAVPFTDILSLGVSASGRLRVVDDVLTDSQPAACQETIRFLLIDPD